MDQRVMRLSILLLALGLAELPASARMGDSLAQTLFRYGQPVAGSGKTGELTSTRTFDISGLEITCGYVGGKVVMETVANRNRGFLPAEIEALLRTESQKRNWTLPDGGNEYTDGVYHRVDGTIAKVTGNKMEVISPAWTEALARDAAMEKEKAARIAAGDTNTAPAETSRPDVRTSAAATTETPGTRPTAGDINSTNAP
jgi:hypothetical protein